MLRQIGMNITKAQLADAVNALINGDATDDANGNAAAAIETQAGTLTYDDRLRSGPSLKISA
ncbi:MAG: hypothetical protein ACLSDO_01355 [Anaerotruncus colihominis]